MSISWQYNKQYSILGLVQFDYNLHQNLNFLAQTKCTFSFDPAPSNNNIWDELIKLEELFVLIPYLMFGYIELSYVIYKW